jgi:hypothetical protein
MTIPDFVNYKKGVLDSQSQVIKFTFKLDGLFIRKGLVASLSKTSSYDLI